MPTLYVTEYPGIETLLNGTAQVVVGPPIAEQVVTIGGSSAQSAAFSAVTRIIRVQPDSICSVRIGGVSPVATTSSQRHIAGSTEYFGVTPGDKVAVITNT